MLSPLLIADDHPLMRSALVQAIQKAVPTREIIEAESVAEVIQILQERKRIGLLCLDLHMADSKGFASMIALRHDYATLPIVIISASDDVQTIKRSLRFGAVGFISKTSSLDEICTAIGAVIDGEVWVPRGFDRNSLDEGDEPTIEKKLASLTPTQLAVLTAVGEGALNKQIAHDMQISEATVKAHLTAIFRKLDVINRTQAVIAAGSLLIEQPKTEIDK